MMPQVLAIAQTMFPPHERAFAFSLFGLAAGLASVAGPLAGGLLIHAALFGLDWRPVFLVNHSGRVWRSLLAACWIRAAAARNPEILTIDFGGVAIAAPVDPAHRLPADRRPRLWLAAPGPSLMIAAALIGFALFYLYETASGEARQERAPAGEPVANGNFVLGSAMTVILLLRRLPASSWCWRCSCRPASAFPHCSRASPPCRFRSAC